MKTTTLQKICIDAIGGVRFFRVALVDDLSLKRTISAILTDRHSETSDASVPRDCDHVYSKTLSRVVISDRTQRNKSSPRHGRYTDSILNGCRGGRNEENIP